MYRTTTVTLAAHARRGLTKTSVARMYLFSTEKLIVVGIYDIHNYNDCDNAESICTLWHCHHTKIANHSGILKYILN